MKITGERMTDAARLAEALRDMSPPVGRDDLADGVAATLLPAVDELAREWAADELDGLAADLQQTSAACRDAERRLAYDYAEWITRRRAAALRGIRTTEGETTDA